MNPPTVKSFPAAYKLIEKATQEAGFSMASDPLTCALLSTLAASKPGGNFLELGTGTGLATAWILAGMDNASTLISLDNDPACLAIAQQYLIADSRLNLIEADGGEWLQTAVGQKFDYIFADTWPGKYFFLDETLALLKPGGFYLIDDMLPQPNWPAGHDQKAADLLAHLQTRPDLRISQLDWATGVVVAVKQ
ncbi:O-methyltransferase [Spirosoma foliorum]|uniref:Class I SAM-dependent methyltransferase n=1 Tax=Spirosoma foliorum TaxID=2710596 RepID=A0A7G5GP06_9BACT|nr:class I SAM-dependent methyltransferase [Spirosoma foliorum]QMW00598.1 class I SAM-dependent methyltransferase [Spirosoma foliorum]